MTLKDQLNGLSGTAVTIWLIGGGVECSGKLNSVGDDYIDIDGGNGQPHWLIPIIAISAVVHRV
jgi:hypothetical protein